MRICFYAPFKPLGHHQPSGDLAIASGIVDYLRGRGHAVWPVSSLRLRWVFWKPWLWPQVLKERRRAVRFIRRKPVDLWLTYHTYYKAPDLLGPYASRVTNLPYVIFQGMYATKRRKAWRTLPGYLLNKQALVRARHVLTNRRDDWINLQRIIAPGRLTYVTPGIYPEGFCFDARARGELRQAWGVDQAPVVLSAAMFRPGVKTRGIEWVIRACGRLIDRGLDLQLVVAGDGREKARLKAAAQAHLPGRARFVGKIDRSQMHRFYSAGDIFCFPGIRESLGMVYLEAQACGLPVVAFDNGGIPEVVQTGQTGLLVPPFALESLAGAMQQLLTDRSRRHAMGLRAAAYVRKHHNLDQNYRKLEAVLKNIAEARMEP